MTDFSNSVFAPYLETFNRVTAPNESVSAAITTEMNGSLPDKTTAAVSLVTDVQCVDVMAVDPRNSQVALENSSLNVHSEELDSSTEHGIVTQWELDGSHNISTTEAAKKDIDFVDGAVVPIKHEITRDGVQKSLYVEGKKLLNGAENLQFHDSNALCIAYLDTSENGILHVIPGWSQREFVEDIAYRFKAGRTMETEIPFLGGLKCKKRSYLCQGVLVCPKSTEHFRGRHHCTVEENNSDVLKTVELLDDTEIMKRNAVNIFLEVKSKAHYCTACLWSVDGVPKRCEGAPVVRERKGEVLYGSRFFLGCTGYHRSPNLNHTIRKLDSLDTEGCSYLRDLLSGKATPPRSDLDQECFYIHSKKKRCNAVCQVHKETLIHIPCEDHRMNIFEPLPHPGVQVPKLVYVSCFGSHTHPPPPPPDHTLRKMQLLEEEAESDPKAPPAILRKRVEEKILKQLREGVGKRKVYGSAHIPSSSGSRRVRKLRQSKRKVVAEAEGLMSLAVDMNFPYCRDIKLVGQDIVVTCAHDSMLMHAAVCSKFAGDATFKTVTESNRKEESGKWYLYNIVAPANTNGSNTRGVIVYRALMTGRSCEVYRVIWRCFFRELLSCSDIIRGRGEAATRFLRVPYLELPPDLVKDAAYLKSITMDLEHPEVQGCAQALSDVCGGSVAIHIAGMMVGCGVHLDRDLKKRSRSPNISPECNMDPTARLSLYKRFTCADTQEKAWRALEDIELIDPAWARWVRTSGLLPVICKTFSTMNENHRADGFKDTNVVESHNRRGNLLAGTHMHPFDAIKELGKLDDLDIYKVSSGFHNELRGPRPPRQRSDYTLAPSGSKSRSSTRKKRSAVGGAAVPAAKRTCLSQSVQKCSKKSEGDEEVQFVGAKQVKQKPGVSFIIHMRVQRMICQLDAEIISDMTVSDEVRDRRSAYLTNLLVSLTEIEETDAEKIKALILKARLTAIREGDRSFGCQLFKIYCEGCLTQDPLSSTENNSARS